MSDMIKNDLGIFTPDDYRKILEWIEGNSRQKEEILSEYQPFFVPSQYQNDWADLLTSYENYLTERIEFSPSELDIIKTFDRSGIYNDGIFQKPLSEKISTSSEWFQSYYDSLGKSYDEKIVFQQYLEDATILVSRYEASKQWYESLLNHKQTSRGKNNWLLFVTAIAIFIMFKVIPTISYHSIFDYLTVIAIPGIPLGAWVYLQHKVKTNALLLDDEINKVQRVMEWHISKANEHPFIYSQGEQSSSLYFGTLFSYFRQGRVNTLQEAMNLYYQERHFMNLAQQQERILQEARFGNQLAIINTVHQFIKK